MRLTNRALISKVNHFEQQREFPGWKISEQKEINSEKDRRGMIGQQMEDIHFMAGSNLHSEGEIVGHGRRDSEIMREGFK